MEIKKVTEIANKAYDELISKKEKIFDNKEMSIEEKIKRYDDLYNIYFKMISGAVKPGFEKEKNKKKVPKKKSSSYKHTDYYIKGMR